MVNQVVDWPLACTCIANSQELQGFAILCNIIAWLSVVTINSVLGVIHNSKPGINDNLLG